MAETKKIEVTHKNAILLSTGFLNMIVEQNKLIIQQLGNIAMKLERPALDLGGSDGKRDNKQQQPSDSKASA